LRNIVPCKDMNRCALAVWRISVEVGLLSTGATVKRTNEEVSMRRLIALVSACLFSSAMWAGTPAEWLSQQVAQAKALAEQHAYTEAAAVLEKLASDIEITTLPD
jgi:hypothetical protein